MIHIEIHDTKHNERIHLGNLGEFVNQIVNEMHLAKATSRIFSRQADPTLLGKEIGFALDRYIQRTRDGHTR